MVGSDVDSDDEISDSFEEEISRVVDAASKEDMELITREIDNRNMVSTLTQSECCSGGYCTCKGMPLNTHSRCASCLKALHGPCGYEVQGVGLPTSFQKVCFVCVDAHSIKTHPANPSKDIYVPFVDGGEKRTRHALVILDGGTGPPPDILLQPPGANASEVHEPKKPAADQTLKRIVKTRNGPKPASELTQEEIKALMDNRSLFRPKAMKKKDIWNHIRCISIQKELPLGVKEWKTEHAEYIVCLACFGIFDYHWKRNSKMVGEHARRCTKIREKIAEVAASKKGVRTRSAIGNGDGSAMNAKKEPPEKSKSFGRKTVVKPSTSKKKHPALKNNRTAAVFPSSDDDDDDISVLGNTVGSRCAAREMCRRAPRGRMAAGETTSICCICNDWIHPECSVSPFPHKLMCFYCLQTLRNSSATATTHTPPPPPGSALHPKPSTNEASTAGATPPSVPLPKSSTNQASVGIVASAAPSANQASTAGPTGATQATVDVNALLASLLAVHQQSLASASHPEQQEEPKKKGSRRRPRKKSKRNDASSHQQGRHEESSTNSSSNSSEVNSGDEASTSDSSSEYSERRRKERKKKKKRKEQKKKREKKKKSRRTGDYDQQLPRPYAELPLSLYPYGQNLQPPPPAPYGQNLQPPPSAPYGLQPPYGQQQQQQQYDSNGRRLY